ncbi:MAG TPA: RodZ domain-containing protein [Opitutales bacterium]|nr:RodZ domain-containing protein [Opitutales bacterium]
MQTIGERLEEARKRKGISLREAAEATKIRSDFLSSIEQNKFDFDLPDIYKRGFLKNYARYLKLDVEKTLTDYNAQQLSNSRLGKKAGTEWFGQMEVKKPERAEDAEAEPEASHSLGRISPAPAASPPEPEIEDDHHEREDESDRTFYLKIGLIFVGTLALVFVVFGLIWAILGSGGDDSAEVVEPELRESSSAGETLTGGGDNGETPASSDSVTLRASGNVYVLVRQKEDDTELYRKTMSAGESVTLEKSGPVDVLFTAGEFLTIEHGGERMRPSSSGTAKITIP